MPLRSPKMNRFIFGFQRRVWCPKCTPASSIWRIVTTAMMGTPSLRFAAPGSWRRSDRRRSETMMSWHIGVDGRLDMLSARVGAHPPTTAIAHISTSAAELGEARIRRRERVSAGIWEYRGTAPDRRSDPLAVARSRSDPWSDPRHRPSRPTPQHHTSRSPGDRTSPIARRSGRRPRNEHQRRRH